MGTQTGRVTRVLLGVFGRGTAKFRCPWLFEIKCRSIFSDLLCCVIGFFGGFEVSSKDDFRQLSRVSIGSIHCVRMAVASKIVRPTKKKSSFLMEKGV